MWTGYAKEYLELNIKFEVFSGLKDEDKSAAEYCSYLEGRIYEVGRAMRRSLADEVPVPAEGDMLNPENVIDSYLDLLNWDWVISAENGMDLAIYGAYVWIDAIKVFFVQD